MKNSGYFSDVKMWNLHPECTYYYYIRLMASTSPLSFYRPDALPATQPTALKH